MRIVFCFFFFAGIRAGQLDLVTVNDALTCGDVPPAAGALWGMCGVGWRVVLGLLPGLPTLGGRAWTERGAQEAASWSLALDNSSRPDSFRSEWTFHLV